MNKGKRIIACFLIILMTAGLMSGCTTFDNFRKAFLNKNPDNDAQITIGIYEPMSGEDKENGEAEIKGIELANKLYPDVNGARIELIYADNKSDIEAAETAMADLIKKSPTAVLGSYGNLYSLIAGSYLEVSETPGIAITNTNPLVTKNNPYYFRVSPVDTYEATAMARYVIETLHQTQVGILVPEGDEQALALAESFENYMTENAAGANTVYQKYKAGSGDFAEQLRAIKDSAVSYVYLCGDSEDVINILRQANEMGMTDVTFLGDSTWSDDEFINEIYKYVDKNIAFTTLYTNEEQVTETSTQFLEAYKEEYGDEEPEAAAALGFDAYLILIQAIERAGVGCSGDELREALAATENFEGASGIITFNNIGDPEKSVVINTLKNKKISPLCTIAPITETDSAAEQAAD